MKNLPFGLMTEILKDPFYSKCCVSGKSPVQLHHNFIYGNKQVQEKWCILPLFHSIHAIEKRLDVKEILDWIMLNRASESDLDRFSRVSNLKGRRDELNKKFGKYDYENDFIKSLRDKSW